MGHPVFIFTRAFLRVGDQLASPRACNHLALDGTMNSLMQREKDRAPNLPLEPIYLQVNDSTFRFDCGYQFAHL
jgi:hypothetical protein